MRENPRTVSRTRNEVTSVDSTRVAMWSGPRNISTALMYSFENRSDCYATDEPLYASFLLKSGTPHPGAEEVIENNESEVGKIITTLTGPIPDEKQIWYQKHMCHHLPPDSDISWIDNFNNCFLIRNPREVLLSLSKITDSIDLLSTGLPQQLTIFRHVIKSSGKTPPVIDSADVLEDPESILSVLCESIGIPFSKRMLSWEPGPRNCDGLWGKYWYDSVWKSSGFSPPTPKDGELSEHLHSVLEESIMIYQELREMRIRV